MGPYSNSVHINLQEDQVGVLGAQGVEDRSNHPTRTAPCRCEINNDLLGSTYAN